MEKIKFHNITKRYSEVLANDKVSFSIPKNKVTIIIGDNGAGKSTLMKIMYGLVLPDSGEIYLDGKRINIRSPRDAINYGIGMVSQHFSLVPSMSVCENVFLGQEPQKYKFLFDYRKARTIIEEICDRYHFNLNLDAKIQDLSVGDKQKVEIIKLLVRKSEVLIFDEPTATLTEDETRSFFDIITKLIAQKKTVVLVTHKFREMLEYGDKFVMMEFGKVSHIFEKETADNSEFIKNVKQQTYLNSFLIKKKEDRTQKAIILDNIGLINSDGKRVLFNVSFSVDKGSIFVITGPEGSGQKELAEIFFNLISKTSGKIIFNDVDISGLSTFEIRNKGISFIPEDRMEFGIATGCSVRDNIISPILLKKRKFFKTKEINNWVQKLIKSYEISCGSINQKIEELSGGNIQKVIIAREFSVNPKLVIAAHLTRGLDINSANFVYKMVLEKSREGVTFLIFSSDLTEVKTLADKILILSDGMVKMQIDNTESLTEKKIGILINEAI